MKRPALLAALARRLSNDKLLDRLLRGGAMALAIKVAAAGLSFLMFMLLARASTIEEFGRFGFAFSLATSLAIVGSFGQRMMVLRSAPAYATDGDQRRLTGIVRYGYLRVFLGCLAVGLVPAIVALVWPNMEHRGYLVASVALTLATGLAEYQARALRAVTGMFVALAPRDVFWRVAVSLLAGAWIFLAMPPMTASAALTFTAALLFAAVGIQAMFHPLTRPHSLFRAPAAYDLTEWRRTSLGLWGVSVMQIAGANSSVVLAGALMDPTATAQLFAALRIATLLELFTTAVQMVSAALISSRWHKGDKAGVQKICRMVTLGAAVPAFGSFLLFVLFGDWVMRMFGSEFAGGEMLLIVLSCGFLAKTVFGQSSLLMQLAGRERAFMRIVTVCNVASIAALVVGTMMFGAIGAAVATAAGMIAWSGWAQIDVRRRLGVDPSLFGALRHLTRVLRRRKSKTGDTE